MDESVNSPRRCRDKMVANRKWRTRISFGVILLAISIRVVNGYEETYTISQLSPKSVINNKIPLDPVLQTSEASIAFSIEPSSNYDNDDDEDDGDEVIDKDQHTIVARSAPPPYRESRSINIDEIPIANNNEIDNELEQHNKRKYYEIHPTKTVDYNMHNDEIVMSEGFGDKFEFKFPGEANRVPKARALAPAGPRIRPTAVQPIFATASYRDQGRQNSDIRNIITSLAKILNGNVNVQVNSQLLNGRPGRPMASRINNRGPPRISDVPPLPEFDKPISPPAHAYHPTKTPPPYPFDMPPHQGVNLPEQIVPPMHHHRPGIYRPMPPWQRPRPKPPNRRPNPGLPIYKPTLPPPLDLPDLEVSISEEESAVSENETSQENNIHEDKETTSLNPEANAAVIDEHTTTSSTTTSTTIETTSTSTTTPKPTEKTTEKPIQKSTPKPVENTTPKPITKIITKPDEKTRKPDEKPTTSKPLEITTPKQEETTMKSQTTTENITITTEKAKTEKINKPDKDKKKDSSHNSEKDKTKDKHKASEEKLQNKTKNDIEPLDSIIQPSIIESKIVLSTSSTATPTPTDGLVTHLPAINEHYETDVVKTAVDSQSVPTSQGIPYQPYRPRPGIVLDDTDFKPHGTRYRPDAPVITAAETRLPGYGEIFDVTVSAIQGPGDKGGSVHIEHVNPISGHGEHDDIIVSASGEQGFVSIDGKRTYLNLFDSSAPVGGAASVKPTQVQHIAHSAPPVAPPPLGPGVGTGIAIPTDDIPQQPVRRPPQLARPQQTYRRPQPTVRIDTCIVGDDTTCDQAQNEKCRTEAGISSCQCRPGYARRVQRDPCRRIVALLLGLRVDRLYDRQVVWDSKLADKDSEPYQQLSFEAVRAIDSAFSMTPFSDDFVSGSVNSVHKGDNGHQGVFVNYTVLLEETAETLRPSVANDVQKHLLGVIRRRSNNVGASALWVDSPAGSVLPLKDVDECSSPELNDCHSLASCTNTWGGFRCSCPSDMRDPYVGQSGRAGRSCSGCPKTHCSERGSCSYRNDQPYCSCSPGYYGSRCEIDGEVVGVAAGASIAAALVIALTLAALLSWSRKWSREQKAAGMGSPIFSYMAANTVKTPPVGQPPYQVSIEERMRWAQMAEAMAQANHYAPEASQTMATRPSSALFGVYPPLPPVPLPRAGLHTGTLNTVTSRANTAASHHNLYGYVGHPESTSSEASSHDRVQERADLLVPRPKSRARSIHNQTGIYYDIDYENAPEAVYGTKGIPLSTYTVSRGPPFYRA